MDSKRFEHLTFLVVILFLGFWGSICVIEVARLIEQKAEASQINVLSQMATGIFGLMGGILIKSPGSGGPVQATITNTPSNPVPTTNEGTDDTDPKGQKDNSNE